MIVIARKVGQLGNRILLFAHFIAWSKEQGVSVANPAFDEYAKYFQGTQDDWLCRFPVVSAPMRCGLWLRRIVYLLIYLPTRLLATLGIKNYPFSIVRLRIDQQCDLNSEWFTKLARKRSPVIVQGWNFRARGDFNRNAEAIREHFRPIESHAIAVAQVVKQARLGGDVLVGVHIRHGDYEKFEGGRYFYSTGQYLGFMQSVKAHLAPRKVTFLVCSNAEQDVREFADEQVTFGGGHEVEDMYSLAECDYIIGPPSTYTMWASFYGLVPLCIIERDDEIASLDRFVVWNDCGQIAESEAA